MGSQEVHLEGRIGKSLGEICTVNKDGLKRKFYLVAKKIFEFCEEPRA